MIMKQDFVGSAVLVCLLGLLAGVAVMAAPAGAEDAEAKIENFHLRSAAPDRQRQNHRHVDQCG
jgi:hypothetical protein